MSSNAVDGMRDAIPQASMDVRRRLVAESLRVGNPANNARDLPAQADPLRECQIELDVDDIRTYEHNPRRADNVKFMEIKESIRASGIRNPITVTRRPGEEHFIIEAGGNTRLFAIQQLWRETGEARFARLTVLFRPWRSESHVLIAHLIENEQRGEMTFWDKASGMAKLKSLLESEQGCAYSVREFEAELKTAGIPISTSTLSYYGFATGRLSALGDAAHALSGLDVRKIQVHLNLARRHAQSRAALDEEALYSEVLEPVFRRHEDAYRKAGTISATALCRDCEEALALHLNEPVSQLRAALDAIAQPPRAAGPAPVSTPDRPALHSASLAPTHEVETQLKDMPKVDVALISPTRMAGYQTLERRIRNFAQLTGIASCLQSDAAAPCGVVVGDMPPVETQLPLQRRSWLLLTLICSRAEAVAQYSLSGDGGVAQGELVFDTVLLGWLLDTTDVAACAYWEVLVLMRELGVLSTQCGASTAKPFLQREIA